MEGECHFNKGNFRAKKRMLQVRKILDTIGLDGQRVEMFNLSSAEAPRFVEVVKEIHDRILDLGPNPMRKVKPGESQVAGSAADEERPSAKALGC
jgi:coenzyme F420-reducing hydrogenase delta subunit